MGHTFSARKRERQNAKRHVRNVANRRVLKKALKTFDKTVQDGSADSQQALSRVQQALDRAAQKRAIPKKRADRKKGRLAKALARAKAS